MALPNGRAFSIRKRRLEISNRLASFVHKSSQSVDARCFFTRYVKQAGVPPLLICRPLASKDGGMTSSELGQGLHFVKCGENQSAVGPPRSILELIIEGTQRLVKGFSDPLRQNGNVYKNHAILLCLDGNTDPSMGVERQIKNKQGLDGWCTGLYNGIVMNKGVHFASFCVKKRSEMSTFLHEGGTKIAIS